MKNVIYELPLVIGVMLMYIVLIRRKHAVFELPSLLICIVILNATASLMIYTEEGTALWYVILRELGMVFILQITIIVFCVRVKFTMLARIIAILAIMSTLPVIIVGFSAIYYDLGLRDTVDNVIIKHDKLIAIYFSAVTFTTTGYGDFVPASDFVRAVAAIQAISGYITFGIIIASMISLFRQTGD